MKRFGLSLALFVAGAAVATGIAAAQPMYEFKLGFAALADLIPEIVGEPLENEHHSPINGDALQQTAKGLMVWRKADNWTAFTNGYRSWINGPFGVEERGNDERFKWEVPALPRVSPPPAVAEPTPVLKEHLLVTWYGSLQSPLMGVLGEYSGEELGKRLRKQAEAYAPLTEKDVLPAYHLVAVIARGSPGDDGLWRQREPREAIDSMLEQARANSFPLILDVQLAHSRVEDELEYLRPYLEQPDVYLALDPEFDMWPGQAPGQQIGHTAAAEVNYAIRYLENIIYDKGLPPKVLIVHQFTASMLPDKERIGRSSVVDLVLNMDGFGSQVGKLQSYQKVMAAPLQYPGIKLFYRHDPGLFTPEQVMQLKPTPSVVVYQ